MTDNQKRILIALWVGYMQLPSVDDQKSEKEEKVE